MIPADKIEHNCDNSDGRDQLSVPLLTHGHRGEEISCFALGGCT